MSRGHIAAAVAALIVGLSAPATASADMFNFPLRGWWPLNEGSGQVVHDWSGQGNNGYLGTTPGVDASDPQWIPGVFSGSALRFDGGDDMVSIPDSKSLEPQNLTVAAWVRGTPGNRFAKYIVAKGGVGCDRGSYALYTGAGGGVAFYIADATTFYRTPEAPASIWDGNWHNVAGTYDGRNVRLYVDGQLIGATPVPAGTSINYNLGSGDGSFGTFPGACQNLNLAGDVDGVQVWSQSLPVDTIWRILKPLFTTSR